MVGFLVVYHKGYTFQISHFNILERGTFNSEMSCKIIKFDVSFTKCWMVMGNPQNVLLLAPFAHNALSGCQLWMDGFFSMTALSHDPFGSPKNWILIISVPEIRIFSEFQGGLTLDTGFEPLFTFPPPNKKVQKHVFCTVSRVLRVLMVTFWYVVFCFSFLQNCQWVKDLDKFSCKVAKNDISWAI